MGAAKTAFTGLSAVPFIGGLFGMGANQLQGEEDQQKYEELKQRLDAINLPQFSRVGYKPEDMQQEQYGSPEEAQYKLAEVDPRIREYQMSALQNLMGVANGSADATQNLARYQAMNDAGQMARAREGAISQEAQMRGMGGGGLEFALRQQASQDAANRAQGGLLQSAQAAAMEKLAAQGNYLQGMGNFRNQDMNQAAINADIINKFNMANSGMRNQTNMANTDIRNRTSSANTANRNTAQQYNLGRNDQNAMNAFNSAMGKEAAYQGAANQGINAGIQNQNTTAALGANQRQTYESMIMGPMAGGGDKVKFK